MTDLNESELDDSQSRDGFTVRDEQSANWVVRKISEARAYARRVEEWAAAETRRAQRQEAFFLARYGSDLEGWARTTIGGRGKFCKSVRLPAGTIGFRTAPSKIIVTDEGQLRAWCKTHLPSAVQTTERLLPSVVSKHAKSTGELPDGADVQNDGERFYVK